MWPPLPNAASSVRIAADCSRLTRNTSRAIGGVVADPRRRRKHPRECRERRLTIPSVAA
jgi:hypothetical protein